MATQLKETLLTTEAATFSAWNASCRGEYCPGRKIHGLTLPNSLVTGFWSTGVLADFRWSLSAPGGPHTMQSCEWRDPVICTSSTKGWCTAAAPTSAPP